MLQWSNNKTKDTVMFETADFSSCFFDMKDLNIRIKVIRPKEVSMLEVTVKQ